MKTRRRKRTHLTAMDIGDGRLRTIAHQPSAYQHIIERQRALDDFRTFAPRFCDEIGCRTTASRRYRTGPGAPHLWLAAGFAPLGPESQLPIKGVPRMSALAIDAGPKNRGPAPPAANPLPCHGSVCFAPKIPMRSRTATLPVTIIKLGPPKIRGRMTPKLNKEIIAA